jgi:hypothetical protein
MFEKQISQSLQDAIKKITSVSEALVGNQHKIDKNKNGKIDAHDFKLLKGQKAAPIKEEEVEELDELSKTALGSYAKKAKGEMGLSAMAAGAQSARGDAVGRAIDMAHAKKRSKGIDKAITRLTKEEVEEQVDETIVKHDDFTVEIKESYTFADYLTAAKQLVGEEEAVTYANEAFKTQDLTIFIMEEMSRGDIEDNINAHRKAGHTVTMPKYSTKDGKPHAEYTVTDKDEGTRRKYIHHGNVRKVENMGAKG